MKLIKQLNDNLALAKATPVAEDAAGGGTSAGAIAGGSMPLFSQLVKRTAKQAKKRAPFVAQPKHLGLGLAEAAKNLREVDGDFLSQNLDQGKGLQQGFDAAQVIARLKGLENKEKIDNRDCVTFGLEDGNQNIVRVTVKAEQAEHFEQSLNAFLQSAQSEEERAPDVAEILFKLKDHFHIVDVQWPDIEQDEEEDMSLEGPEGESNLDAESEMGGGNEMAMDAPGADAGQATDLLTQVIDMMKADAEARKAEARAREAEAKTKEADALVAQAMSRVKQEEQYLDMESYNKAKKDQEREAKRLAMLAKWKHDMNSDGGVESEPDAAGMPLIPNREEEEAIRYPVATTPQRAAKAPVIRSRVSPHEIAQFIIDRVK